MTSELSCLRTHKGILYETSLLSLTPGTGPTQLGPLQASAHFFFLLCWRRGLGPPTWNCTPQPFNHILNTKVSLKLQTELITILTAGLRGRNASFLSSGFLAALSRRCDGEPSDLDDAITSKRDKKAGTDKCTSQTVHPPAAIHLASSFPLLACQPLSRV